MAVGASQAGTNVVCNPPSKSPTQWQPESEVSSWQVDEVQLAVTHVDTVQTFTS